MPTNEKRREVAVRLALAGAGIPMLGDGMKDRRADCAEDALVRLADLIEPESERTCRMKYDHVRLGIVCAECGECLDVPTCDARDEDGDLVYGECRFCPNCGAKVVDGR